MKMKHIFKKIRWAFQRAKRGYSDFDVGDIECWFFRIVPRMLDDYLSRSCSWPGKDKYKGINTREDWVKEISNLRDIFLESCSETCSEINAYDIKDWDNYCRRNIEIDEYLSNNKKKALRLFVKYLHDLWD